MEIEREYKKAFDDMESIIESRVQGKKFAALGYTSNLDVLCDFKVEILNDLLKKHVPYENLNEMRPPALISSIEDFLYAIVYYCINGIGGEADIADFKIIGNTFRTKYGMGGTATQGAMALAAVKCPSMVHLTDDSKEVCDILNSPFVYTVSPEGTLIHTDKVKASAEQEIHYIIQFKKGDMIILGSQKIPIPLSNRLIVTKITVNETVPFSEPYFKYIEKNAENIASNVLSSFNAIQKQEVLKERLAYVAEHCRRYKKGNQTGILYFEDAHYHNTDVRKMCLESIYPYVDIVSLNEEELAYTLKMYDHPIDISDIVSCVNGLRFIIQNFHINKGVIVHTKDYSMYVGDDLGYDIKKGLMYGNMLATAKAMTGWYGSKAEIEKVMELPLSPAGIKNQKVVEEADFKDVTLVPSKYIDKPQYTIGLGDSFVAGVQLCFI